MAFPLAKTLAVKDAADMFGKLFGSDLNRRDTLPASMDKPRLTDEEKAVEIGILLNENRNITIEDRMYIERILDEKEISSYDKVLKMYKV